MPMIFSISRTKKYADLPRCLKPYSANGLIGDIRSWKNILPGEPSASLSVHMGKFFGPVPNRDLVNRARSPAHLNTS